MRLKDALEETFAGWCENPLSLCNQHLEVTDDAPVDW